ncbi:MAG: adenosylcobinamide-GDP ribazoletransferase [Thermodesulfobacteriota bacterium]|nr:adenosylcobinamide-GDP ribazoletransferase [Thermodesulfobacteriota bacterium]
MIKDFKSALMFITILPTGRNTEFSPSGMVRFFPVVGLFLGALLIVTDLLSSLFWPLPVAALMDVLFLAAVTGAFHLDGLGDTADGLFSHRSPQRALEIMKDSRTGMMGLVAVFSILALKTAGIYSLKNAGTGMFPLMVLLIVPAYARGGMLFGMRFLKYGRKNTGTGLGFFKNKLLPKDFIFLCIPVAVSLCLGMPGMVLNLVFALVVFLILMFYKSKLGCITGDMLGAMTEITEAVLFLAAGAV